MAYLVQTSDLGRECQILSGCQGDSDWLILFMNTGLELKSSRATKSIRFGRNAPGSKSQIMVE